MKKKYVRDSTGKVVRVVAVKPDSKPDIKPLKLDEFGYVIKEGN